MSKAAAKEFGISHEDFQKFLLVADEPLKRDTIAPAIKITDHAKHVILVVSVFLFAIAFFTCIATLAVWAIARRRRKRAGYKELEKTTEKAELACNEETLSESIKSTPSLPQIFDKPKVAPVEFSTRESSGEEELRKLRVEKLDVTASFYTNRKQLQITVRRVNLNSVDDTLSQNAFIYLIVSLLPDRSSYYESELRPVAEENYFEEASEFELTLEDIPTRTLKVSVFASDRFSQHRLVNEFTYKMEYEIDPDDTILLPVLAISLTEVSRSDDNEVPEKIVKEGEVLFSLCYMPTSGRLTFVALKGRNICDKEQSPIATYLRVSLMVSGKTMKTVQTTSVRKSSSPVYNEAFVFHTPLERIKDTDVIVSVMASEDINNTQPKMLGKLIVGPESGSNLGRKHWEAMLTTPRRPVAQWHSISEFL